ncbi:MAG: aldo/keto reductase, partial [Proteobacteria bacterium]|nr:aldo/keto reductase [Pseudomonadota bacterium]
PYTPLEETMQALNEVVEAGKARYIGFSEWTAPQIQAAMNIDGVASFVSSQPQYSMIWRDPEAKVIPLCRENGIGQIVWSPLGQGILTGKYRPGSELPADSRAANPSMNQFMERLLDDSLFDAVDNLRPLADELGMSLSQLALAWVLREPNVASAIVGASRPEQVEENAAASGIQLDDETLTAIDEALAGIIQR